MSLHTLERITIGTTMIKGLTNVRYAPEYQAELRAGGSELDATLRAIHAGVPLITFDTLDVSATLQLLFNSGGVAYMVPRLTVTGYPLILYLQSIDDGITRGGAGTNLGLKVTKGLLIPTRVSGDGALAVLSCALYVDYDGTNLPVQKLTAQTLPGGSGAGAATLSRLTSVLNGATAIGRVSDWTVDFGIQVVRPPSRDIYPRDAHIVTYAPTATFRTADLSGALAVAGFATTAAASGGVKFILANYDADNLGIETTGAVGLVARVNSRIAPRLLDFSGEVAQLDYLVVGRGNTAWNDATDSPMTLATGLSVPAETASVQTYKAGPAYDGATRRDVRSGRLEFGLSVQGLQPENQLWPTKVAVMTRTPELALTLDDDDAYAALGEGFALSAGWAQYLRALTSDGLPAADITAVHIQILLSAGWVEPRGLDGRHGALSRGDIRVTTIKGANPLVTVNTGVAIAAL
mgnify:FL=1